MIWALKNWKIVLAGLVLVFMGGKLAFAEIQVNRLERKNITLQKEVLDCEAHRANQNAQIESLGKELAHFKRRSKDALRRNEERLANAEKRIQLIRGIPAADDCIGSIDRFARQLKREVW